MLRIDATAILKDVQDKAALILKQTGNDVLNIADQLVPVDKGDLKASGRVENVTPTNIQIGYGNAEVDYAKYQEFGTSEMPAQPFLTPAMAQAESIIKSYASMAKK
jgi:HK97 gp10 family phage protein